MLVRLWIILLLFSTFSCHRSLPSIQKIEKDHQDLESLGKSVLIHEENKLHFGPCEPSIAINPRDPREIVVGSVLKYVHYSRDHGETWETDVLDSPLGVYGDPVIKADPKGNFYYFHLGDPNSQGWDSPRFLESIVVQRSSDGGANWTKGSAIGPNPPKQQDKEWACLSPDGKKLYVSWTEFDKYGDKSETCKARIRFSQSSDQAKTWSDPITISSREGNCLDSDHTPEGAVPASDKNGNIYISWAYNNEIFFDRSMDGGISWLEADRQIGRQTAGWDMNIPGLDRCNGMPVTAIDLSNSPHQNTIYVVYADQKKDGSDTDIFLIKSIDKGDHWSSPINVFPNDQDRHQFLPWLSVDPRTGNVYIVYYDRSRYDDLRTDVMIAKSTNGGESFQHRVVSEKPFIPPGDAKFFGDYNNIDAFAGMVRPVWTAYYNGKLSIWTSNIYWP